MVNNPARTRSESFTRRQALAAGVSALAGSAALTALAAARQPPGSASQPLSEAVSSQPAAGVSAHDALLRPGDEKIAILIYPHFTALDAIGPHHVFCNLMGATVQLVAKTMDPVPTDTGFAILPTATFVDIAARQTLLLVPGGTSGTLEAMKDEATMAFLRRHGAAAEWLGSVCTGSLLLAAAGLLRGYKATSHWLTMSALRAGGAEPIAQRHVEDRNRVTGAGVTAGIDFALHLVHKWRGAGYAKGVQMFMEYDPQPPFRSGTPTCPEADPAMVQLLTSMHESFVEMCTVTIQQSIATAK